MQKNMFRKTLALGIIVMFVGAGIVPAVGCVFTDGRMFTVNKINDGSISDEKVLSNPNFLYDLTVNVVTDKTIYKRFEPVEITISATNHGEEDIVIIFPYINLLADFDIGNGLYQYSRDQILLPMIIDVIFPSGETVELLKTDWNQFSNIGTPSPFEPGIYKIRGWLHLGYWPSPPFGYSKPITLLPKTRPSIFDFNQINWLLERLPLLERLLNLI